MYAFYARDMKQSLRCLKCMLSQKYTLHCLKHTPRRMLSEIWITLLKEYALECSHSSKAYSKKQCNPYFIKSNVMHISCL